MSEPKQIKESLVSIILPSYNYEQFVADAIRSILAQSYRNIELIVIDDGSSDKSPEIIEGLASRHNFLFFRQKNQGLCKTLNTAIRMAKGEFVSFCAADDLMHPDKIFKQVQALEKNPASGFCYCKSYVIDDAGSLIEDETSSYNHGVGKQILFDDVLTFKVHLPVNSMYRTSFLREELGGFDESLAAEDYDTYLKIVTKTPLTFVDDYLYYYRSPVPKSGRRRPPMRFEVSESHRLTIEKYAQHPKFDEAMQKWNFRRFTCFAAYRETKVYAINGMLRCGNFLLHRSYIIAFAKLFLFWKSYNR